MTKKAYLGDGVYIEWTGFDFVLSTPREGKTHYIHLGPCEINALNSFVTSCTLCWEGKSDE